MKIVVAPGSFKGTITSCGVAEAIQASLRRVLPSAELALLPLADGGEGTIEIFERYLHYHRVRFSVSGPLGVRVPASVGSSSETTALIETSQAIGLSLVSRSNRNPLRASSRGVGELILNAVRSGAQRVLISMGDSCTMDMGAGMLSALGVRFFTFTGDEVDPIPLNLGTVHRIDYSSLDKALKHVEFIGLVDTNDILCGPFGQVQLYGAQKGLLDEDVPFLEESFQVFGQLLNQIADKDVLEMPYSTGSGGLAASLHALLRAPLVGTLDFLARYVPLGDIISQADVSITGEGRLDNQTRFGKVPHFVAEQSSNSCIVVVGSSTPEGVSDLERVCRDVIVTSLPDHLAFSEPALAIQVALERALVNVLPGLRKGATTGAPTLWH